MHFSRSRDAKRICATPITLYNALGPGQHFTATPPTAIQWLGIWMDSQLLWNAHTQKMAAKAQSALTAMNLLSNTMRGITGRHMRILYLGCVIPILTWGAEVWYTSQREGPRLIQHLSL